MRKTYYSLCFSGLISMPLLLPVRFSRYFLNSSIRPRGLDLTAADMIDDPVVNEGVLFGGLG
jgi:hypothetical protein